MLSSIFGAIQLILQLIGLWDQFLSWSDAKRLADDEAKRQAREKAIGDLDKAESDDDIFKSETGIIDNKP